MNWTAIGRYGLWALAIFLAALGGAFLRSAITSYTGAELSTFLGLVCSLTAAAIYRQRLRW